jgi:amino acid adenylation domain-containing protein
MNNDGLWEALTGLVSEATGVPASILTRSDNIFAFGVDSLGLLKIGQEVEKRFRAELPLALLADELSTLGAIRDWLERNGGPVPPETAKAEATPAFAVETAGRAAAAAPLSSGDHRRLALAGKQMEDFLALSRMQWEAFRQPGGEAGERNPAKNAPPPNLRAFHLAPDKLDETQRTFVDDLVARHASRTAASKAHTARHRPHFADWKHTLGFRTALKRAFYPIVAAEAGRGRFRDLDGNEYLDLALGMGVNYLGHAPDYVADAVRDALAGGMPLGPQNRDAGEAAKLVAELTGMERVAWSNTGSEAVMFALRLARARTGRRRIALFAGSYHGIGDGVLAMATPDGTAPASAGVPPGAVAEVTTLEYGGPAALEEIDRLGCELAAVLVEPVQSRKPALQPARFLRRLRKLADKHGFALVFDELITGFRIRPGGAQEWFGVKADLACYGKILGGGLPVSAVAGSARFLDGIDGGQWSYDDDSLPSAEASGIVYGGTYCRHPLAMAAVKAVMNHLKNQGPRLQERTNALAARLCDTLNLFFEREEAPIRVERFASQFRFESFGRYNLLLNPIEMDLLFLLLMEMGVYTWERRICFISTEHDDRDVDRIIAAVKEAVGRLRAGGFPFRSEPDAPRRFFPMTPAQLRVFAVMERPGAGLLNHLVAAFEVGDELDADRLEDAISDVVARHEALRTSLHLLDGEAAQKIWREAPFLLERYGEVPLDEFARRFLRPFAMDIPPLFRAAMARLGDGRRVLAFDLHHAVADGLSLDIIAREVAERYAGAEPGDPPRPYRDFHDDVAGLRHPEITRDLAESWRTELASQPPAPGLPRSPGRESGGFAGGRVFARWDRDRTEAARVLAGNYGVTPFMLHAALLGLALRRLTGAEDMYIGTVAGARPPGAEATVGMFANTLPLRLAPGRELRVADYMRQVRKNCLATLAKQNCPFEIIAEQSPYPASPLFTVMFPYERAAKVRSTLIGGLDFKPIDLPVPSSFYDLNWEVIEEDEEVRFKIGHRDAAITGEAATRLVRLYEALFDEIAKGGDIRIGDMKALPADERAWLEARENPAAASGAASPAVPSFPRAWREAVAREKDGDPPAIRTADGIFTRRELDRSAEILAGRLAAMGVRAGDRVATLLAPGISLVAAALAAWRLGCVYLPLDPGSPRARNEDLLRRLRAAALIKGDGQPERLDTAPIPTESAGADYVFFTSGSTGEPKAVVGRLAGVMHFLDWEGALVSNSLKSAASPPRVAWLSRPAFDASLRDMFLPLLFNGTLLCPDAATRENPSALARWIVDQGVTVLHAVPSVFRLLAEAFREGGFAAPDLRLVMLAGEALTGAEVTDWRFPAPAAAFVNLYGPTETTMVKTFAVLDGDLPPGVLGVGTPIPGSRAYIMEAVDNPDTAARMPRGAWGEVWLAGEGVTQGYFGMPAETAKRFVADPFGKPGDRAYRTGDLGRWNEDGCLEIWGRLDSQVKVRGVRVEPEEIRRALMALPGASAAAVVPFEETPTRRELAAYVVGTSTPEALRAGLRECLPAALVPKYIAILPSLPLTRTGKVDVKRLPPPGPPSGSGSAAPAGAVVLDATALRIRDIFADILGLDATILPPTASFFALGGHSLSAMRLIGKIHAAFGVSLGMADIFELGSLRAIAARVDDRRFGARVPSPGTEGLGEAEEVVVLTPEERAELGLL